MTMPNDKQSRSELVERLVAGAAAADRDRPYTSVTMTAAASAIEADQSRIKALEAENVRLREVVEWYGEQARLCRLIHSDGDVGRHALSADGGHRARSALNPEREEK